MKFESLTNHIARLATLVIAFAFFSFGYSFLGFLHQQPTIHFHEYALEGIIVELAGHFVFGTISVLPLLDGESILLGGALGIFIDADHVLGALNLNVSSRPDHSILFVLFSTLFLVLVARRTGKKKAELTRIVFVVPAAILSHIAYDVLASFQVSGGQGFTFPLFAPFSFELLPLPFSAWILLELLAFSTAACGRVTAERRNLTPDGM